MVRLLYSLFATSLLLTPVHAQCGVQYYYQQPQYVQQQYYYPQQYVQQKVIAQEIQAAPLVVGVPVVPQAVPINQYGAGHYYSVQDHYQQRSLIRDIVREEMKAYLNGQVAGGGGGGGGGNVTPTPPVQPPGPQQPQQPPLYQQEKKVTDLGPDKEVNPSLATQVIQAFKETGCIRCHGQTQTSGGLRLVYEQNGEYTLARQTPERRWTIYGQASTGVMPPAARNDASKAMKQEYLPNLLRWVLGS